MVWFSFLFLSFQSKNLCYSSMLAWFGFSVFYWLTTCLEKTVDNLNKKLEKWKKSILVFHVTLWLCVHPVLAFHLIQNTWIRTPILFNCESLWFLAKIICLKVEGSFIFMKNILRTYYSLKRTLADDLFQFHSCFDDCFCFQFWNVRSCLHSVLSSGRRRRRRYSVSVDVDIRLRIESFVESLLCLPGLMIFLILDSYKEKFIFFVMFDDIFNINSYLESLFCLPGLMIFSVSTTNTWQA
jgi:hypothetical protein